MEIVRYALSHDALIEQADDSVEYAVRLRNYEILVYLVQQGTNINNPMHQLLSYAAYGDDFKIVKYLAEHPDALNFNFDLNSSLDTTNDFYRCYTVNGLDKTAMIKLIHSINV